VVAEDVLDLRRRDAGAGAGLGAVTVEQRDECAPPFVALGPGDQPGDVVRRGQGSDPSGGGCPIRANLGA
jgi:hypothetical protein